MLKQHRLPYISSRDRTTVHLEGGLASVFCKRSRRDLHQRAQRKAFASRFGGEALESRVESGEWQAQRGSLAWMQTDLRAKAERAHRSQMAAARAAPTRAP